ncbi:uncharacterized protein IUM83_06089 [Phytophthora cinnamomi]|uniref:uncharacterized protein n=1 Tax=Phytophthora cinnamomi TaxID=4785 RepID=UPI00355AA90E|nr:hypothetical protein IUM83_06089 [Phytophthora cinnamomi]
MQDDLRRANALLVAHAEEPRRSATRIQDLEKFLSIAGDASIAADAEATRAQADELQAVSRAEKYRTGWRDMRRTSSQLPGVARSRRLSTRVVELESEVDQAVRERDEGAVAWCRLIREERRGRKSTQRVRDLLASRLANAVISVGDSVNTSDLIRQCPSVSDEQGQRYCNRLRLHQPGYGDQLLVGPGIFSTRFFSSPTESEAVHGGGHGCLGQRVRTGLVRCFHDLRHASSLVDQCSRLDFSVDVSDGPCTGSSGINAFLVGVFGQRDSSAELPRQTPPSAAPRVTLALFLHVLRASCKHGALVGRVQLFMLNHVAALGGLGSLVQFPA